MNPDNNTPEPSPALPNGNNNMKRVMGVGLLLVVVVLIMSVSIIYVVHHTQKKSTANISQIAPATVDITSSGFSPKTIGIKEGQAVIWVNHDTVAHEVAADPYPLDDGIPGFNSHVVLLPNDNDSFIFTKVGTYHYHDQLNPTKYLGTVNVYK